jgi:subtilase family serine protease
MPERDALTKMIVLALILIAMLLAIPEGHAQKLTPAQPLITGPIVETSLVTLSGNTRPEANAVNDRRRVANNFRLEHMMLQLKRAPAQQQALDSLIDQLHDPQSPKFHHWLSASDIGTQFGPATSDIQTITGWLQQYGFTVNTLSADRMVIDFSGTAGQVRAAFHTEIHNLEVNGVAHIANMSDPQIPAALAPVVAGIVSLNDFKPKAAAIRCQNFRSNVRGNSTNYCSDAVRRT